MCMGSSGSDAGAQKSKAIDKQIRTDEKRMAREVKLLLLGKYPDVMLVFEQAF